MTSISEKPVLSFIGQILTPFSSLSECPKNSRFSTEQAVVEIYPEFAEGLNDVEASSHLILLYWLHESDRERTNYTTHMDKKQRGVFAIRSPSRPNPIGFSAVKLNNRRGRFLDIGGIDCLNQTPLLDIKPYIAANDCIANTSVDWLDADYTGVSTPPNGQ